MKKYNPYNEIREDIDWSTSPPTFMNSQKKGKKVPTVNVVLPHEVMAAFTGKQPELRKVMGAFPNNPEPIPPYLADSMAQAGLLADQKMQQEISSKSPTPVYSGSREEPSTVQASVHVQTTEGCSCGWKPVADWFKFEDHLKGVTHEVGIPRISPNK